MEIKKVFVFSSALNIFLFSFIAAASHNYKLFEESKSVAEQVVSEETKKVDDVKQEVVKQFDSPIESPRSFDIASSVSFPREPLSCGTYLNPSQGYFMSKQFLYNQKIVGFAKRIYNSDCETLLSQDGDDVVMFLGMAKDFQLDIVSLSSSLRLIANKMKSCDLIDDTVLTQVLEPMPELLRQYLDRRTKEERMRITSIQDLERQVDKAIEKRFNQVTDPRNLSSDLFVSSLSVDVNSLVKKEFEAQMEDAEERDLAEKLRGVVFRFVDTMLSRVVWYAESYEGIWPSFLAIADKLHILGIEGVLCDQDNLDDLWDTLLRRFKWFLELKGSSLPVAFYEQIEDDMESNVVPFLEADEPDGVTPKKVILSKAIFEAKSKAIAFAKSGVITDQLS